MNMNTGVMNTVQLADSLDMASKGMIENVCTREVNCKLSIAPKTPLYRLQEIPEVTMEELQEFIQNSNKTNVKLDVTAIYLVDQVRKKESFRKTIRQFVYSEPSNKSQNNARHSEPVEIKERGTMHKYTPITLHLPIFDAGDCIIGYDLIATDSSVEFNGINYAQGEVFYVDITELGKLMQKYDITFGNARISYGETEKWLDMTVNSDEVLEIVVGALDVDNGRYLWDSAFKPQLDKFRQFQELKLFNLSLSEHKTDLMMDISDICVVDNIFGVCLKTTYQQEECVYLAKQDCNDIMQRVTNSFHKAINYQNYIQLLETPGNGGALELKVKDRKAATNLAKSKGVFGIFNAFKRGE